MAKALEITLQIPMDKVEAEINSTIECLIEDLRYILIADYDFRVAPEDARKLGKLLEQYAADHKKVLVTEFGDYLDAHQAELVEAFTDSEIFWDANSMEGLLEAFIEENQQLIEQMASKFDTSPAQQIEELQHQAKNLGYKLVKE